MTSIELILKWELKHHFFAKKLGMSKGNFNNKIKGNCRWCYFKKEELGKLEAVLKELKADLEKVK